MKKDFDGWNEIKKKLNERKRVPFCNPREIWWASIGLNIGSEEDGKNDLFERPVLIIKVFNRRMLRVIPLTGSVKDDFNHLSINYSNRSGSLIISQMTTISSQRLLRRMCKLDKYQFNSLRDILKERII